MYFSAVNLRWNLREREESGSFLEAWFPGTCPSGRAPTAVGPAGGSEQHSLSPQLEAQLEDAVAEASKERKLRDCIVFLK